ncbi:MAG: glycosyltransferase, partial [Clostridiales bacterium]|nr:glycosyltransferase [Clostridiales bacterium]
PVNKYSWHKISKGVVVIKGEIPECDVAIATTPKNVDHTLSLKAKRKFYYIRGYEVFWCSKELVHSGYKKIKCIVNSEWLQRKLNSLGVNSEIVYPGLDFDLFSKNNDDRGNILGGLFHNNLKTKNHKHVLKVSKSLGYSTLMLNRDISSPSPESLRSFYNKIKVWMAPTELEGLHNPPMEASLCGCGLVATDHEMSGMSDYAKHLETALIYPAGDLKLASQYVSTLMKDKELRDELNDNMVELLRKKIGNRKDNMRKILEIIA